MFPQYRNLPFFGLIKISIKMFSILKILVKFLTAEFFLRGILYITHKGDCMYYGCGRDRSVLVCQRIPVYQALWIPVIGEELVCVREPRTTFL